MKLAKLAFLVTLLMLSLIASVSAQTLRRERDPRNVAPTVGTGGTVGGPTGLFTVYDGATLRRGEWTLSIAYSNYDRDPGNVDITEVPLSFQIGLNDYLELFFTTDGFRALKVNSPRHLSSFYLPNSQFNFGGVLQSGPAIVLAPQGPGASQFPGFAVFRPQGTQPFVQFPYIGGSTGNFGMAFPSGPIFGFPAGTFPTIGAPIDAGASANFPGMGSVYGSILPGVVLQTVNLGGQCTGSTAPGCQGPSVFTIAPTYLPDAPLINRQYGTSSFGTFSVGGKWRWTGPNNPIGVGLLAYYQWYADNGSDPSGWNMLQRGASGGGNKGDVTALMFADARVRKWMNVSANVGYKWTSAIKADFPSGSFTVLDRPDELIAAFGLDFPVNKFFQPILEFRSLQYVGGRTPNAFENSPMDGLAGIRVFPARWLGFGAAYRHHFNQQDRDSFDGEFDGTVTVAGTIPVVINNNFSGLPPGFQTSNDPHGFIFQFWVGRRNALEPAEIPRPIPDVTSVTLSSREIVLPCQEGYIPREGENCPDNTTISLSTTATNPENEVLVYQYTVSGGRIVGQGANVTWDLSGVRAGTYTVTTAVDNGCGFCGKTVTETITIRECECILRCVCPTVTVSGGGVVDAGTPLNFTASAVGGTSTNLTYNWTVSAGTISDGQGTPSITVDTTGLEPLTNITATVTVSTNDGCDCPGLTGSEIGSIREIPGPQPVDEFDRLSNDEVRARLDAFFIALQNNPNDQGYIINYGPDREVTRRERLIQNHIRFRNFDASRITMVRGGDTGVGIRTTLWRVPPGAENPVP
jgi:hypothetical protein